MSKQTLVLSNTVSGFGVSNRARISPVMIKEGELPPPPISRQVRSAAPEPPPPPTPKVDLDAVRKEAVAAATPGIQQAAEKRVRAACDEQYKKQLEQELNALQEKHKKEMEEALGRRDAVIQQFERQFGDFVDGMRTEISSEVIECSVQIAELILRRRLPDHDMMLDLLKITLTPISDLQGMRIRVSPDDYALMMQDGVVDISYEGQFDWSADSGLQPGDMIIESRNGIFDASLSQRMELLKEQLRLHAAAKRDG